jgi:hypothetical protein
VIKQGQKIHASVAFIKGYTPQAAFANGFKWGRITEKGRQYGVGWARGIEDILEMDLFDHSNVKTIMEEVKRDVNNLPFINRLEFLASTCALCSVNNDYECW